MQVPEHRNPTGPGHGGEGVGLQPVGMDQIRRGPAECRPQPPDEPDRRRGLTQRGPPKPEPGQGAGPAIVPQPSIPESGKAGRQRHHRHGRPKPLGLRLERTAGEQHHFQSCAGKVFAGPANRGEQNPLGPAHDPDRAQKGDSHGVPKSEAAETSTIPRGPETVNRPGQTNDRIFKEPLSASEQYLASFLYFTCSSTARTIHTTDRWVRSGNISDGW